MNAKEPTQWPYELPRKGQTLVTIRREITTVKGKGYPSFFLTWRESGAVKRKRLSKWDDAHEFGLKTVDRLKRGIVGAVTLAGLEAERYRAAKECAEDLGMSVDVAVDRLARLVKAAGSLPAIENAVEMFAGVEIVKDLTVQEAVKRFLEVKRGEVGDRDYTDLRLRLGKFSEAFQMNLAGIRPEGVRLWLDATAPESKRTWNNYFVAVKRLCKWCEDQALLPPGWRGLHTLKKKKVTRDDRQEQKKVQSVFTPEQFEALLKRVTGNILQVTEEAGNSPAMARRYDLKHVSEEEARKWFEVLPG